MSSSFSSLVTQALHAHLQKNTTTVDSSTLSKTPVDKKEALALEREHIKFLTKKMQALCMLGDLESLQEVIAQGANAQGSFGRSNTNPLLLAIDAGQPHIVQYFLNTFGVKALGPYHVFGNLIHACLKKDDAKTLQAIAQTNSLANGKVPRPPSYVTGGQWLTLALHSTSFACTNYLLDSKELQSNLPLLLKEARNLPSPTALLAAIDHKDFERAQNIWTHLLEGYKSNNIDLFSPEKTHQAFHFHSFLTRNLNATGFLFLASLSPALFNAWDQEKKYQMHSNIVIPQAFRVLLHIPDAQQDLVEELQQKQIKTYWTRSSVVSDSKFPLTVDSAFKKNAPRMHNISTAQDVVDQFGLFEFLIAETKGNVLKELFQYEPFSSNFATKIHAYQNGAPGWEILLLCAHDKQLKEAVDPHVDWNALPLPKGLHINHFAFTADLSGRHQFWMDLLKKEHQDARPLRQSSLTFLQKLFEHNKDSYHGTDKTQYLKFIAQAEKTFLTKNIGRTGAHKKSTMRRL